MKICTNCGNKVLDDEKLCSVCKTKAKDFPVIDDGDTERAAELIEAVRTKNMSKKDVVVKKKKGKGCLIAIAIVVILGIIGMALNDDDKDVKESSSGVQTLTEEGNEVKKEPVIVTADEMIAALKENALNASTAYKGVYVEVTGKVSNIDSSGNYFSITEIDKEYSFDSILCNISKEHLDAVSSLKKGQEVTVVGTVKNVGEVMGYSLDVESIKQ